MANEKIEAASRRIFIKTAAVASASAAAVNSLGFAPSVFAAGDDTIRVGLIGCGGREQALLRKLLLLKAESNLFPWEMCLKIDCNQV